MVDERTPGYQYVFADIDDTMTNEGKLGSSSFESSGDSMMRVSASFLLQAERLAGVMQ